MDTCKDCGVALREGDVALCKTCRQNAAERVTPVAAEPPVVETASSARIVEPTPARMPVRTTGRPAR